MTELKRELGVLGATGMGLGSIVGTGVFVSIAIATGTAGAAVIPAIGLAALVALCNGLSSAQLAAVHPVSGGTYEYAYRFLAPVAGFLAGWTFLIAKSASAATAALGFSGYLLSAFGVENDAASVVVALAAVVGLTAVVLAGIRRSSTANVAVVAVTLAALAVFVVRAMPPAVTKAPEMLSPLFEPVADTRPAAVRFFAATALMFVAYTGYGRIATLGEEVREPHRTIPKAIGLTLAVVMLLYAAVGFAAVAGYGPQALAKTLGGSSAPLEEAALGMGYPVIARIVAVGAITAMLGVLLNLILGLSRVLLAMGRRGDMPAVLGKLNEARTTPTAAVLAVGVIIALIALLGDVTLTWSFSAFTVLLYYALTNLAALRIPRPQRLFGRWISVAGLVACLGLAWFVEPRVWGLGLVLVAAGLLWFLAAKIRRAT
jgi:APA family basic amino acid/polyamine antiporter